MQDIYAQDDVVRFDVLTDEQLDYLNRRPRAGVVNFKILEIRKGKTKAEPFRPWLMIKVNITDDDGISEITTTFIWLDGKNLKIFKEMLTSIGMEHLYDNGSFNLQEITELEGKLDCFYKDEIGQDGNTYNKLKVKKWIPRTYPASDPNDDIPF